MLEDRKRTITILTPCLNEVDNVEELTDAIIEVGNKIPDIKINHLFIDNASTDGTVEKLRSLSSKYIHVQVILNNRNYGHIRSPMPGFFQAKGDAVVLMASDDICHIHSYIQTPVLTGRWWFKWLKSDRIGFHRQHI